MKPNNQLGEAQYFPFSEDISLPNDPMTDDEFAKFVQVKNDEIPVEQVNFSRIAIN